MANIKLNRKIFEKEIGKLDSEMEHKIAMFGTPIDALNDREIEIEVYPNRPDLLSYQGFKRSFLSFLGKKPGLKEYKINKPEKNYQVIIDSSVKNIRPFTVCAIIKNLKLNDETIKEIIDLQEKLHLTLGRKRKKLAIGIYPLDKITLPIKYKALEPEKIKFTPLEGEREMSGLEILERTQTGREYLHLLAGKPKFPVFLDANDNVLSMPPIINSKTTGKVTEETKEIFIECSGYEKPLLKKCLNIITAFFLDINGTAYQMDIKDKTSEITPDLSPSLKNMSLENVKKILGIEISEKDVKKLLEKMGHNYEAGKVHVPSWRIDIIHEVDLAEEIAIAYGYDNITPLLPNIPSVGKEDNKEKIKRKICEIITGLKFIETSSFHLTTKENQFLNMGIPLKNLDYTEIQSSKTEYNILRENLSHCLMRIFSENTDAEYPQKIFEIGKVFTSSLEEKNSLSGGISPGNFTDLKQVLIYLFDMLNIKVSFLEAKNAPPFYIDGRVAEITLNSEKIGYVGEVHPRILRNWKINMPVSIFEISLEKIFEELIKKATAGI